MPPRRRNNGLSQLEVERQLRIDSELIWHARRLKILESTYAPGGEIFYSNESVNQLHKELDLVRASMRDTHRRGTGTGSKQRALQTRARLESGLNLYICESCGFAVSVEGKCRGCNPTARF